MTDDLPAIARRIRRRIVRMHHAAQVGHLGSSLSCADILVAGYFGAWHVNPLEPTDPKRDRFVLSKGHAATALYACLADHRFFPDALLDTFCQSGALLAEHPPAHGLAGVEFAGGSLGHGLGVATGMALASRISGVPYRVFVLAGDGEMMEGSNWEALAFAARQKLGNLVLVIDGNGLGGVDREVDDVPTLIGKLDAFGWHAVRADGHNPALLAHLMSSVPLPGPNPPPLAIVARTVKGWPISFLNNSVLSHYKTIDDRELETALAELQ